MNITEPAAASAAGICWLTRWQRIQSLHGMPAVPVSHRHASECGWCAYPLTALVDWIEEFNAEDGPDHRLSRRFRSLPPERQRALVIEAQAFEVPA